VIPVASDERVHDFDLAAEETYHRLAMERVCHESVSVNYDMVQGVWPDLATVRAPSLAVKLLVVEVTATTMTD